MSTTPTTQLPADAPVLFYDGDCAVCARSVRFILAHEKPRPDQPTLRFARRRGPLGDALHREHPALESVDSLLWRNPDGSVRRYSAAVIAAARYLGGIYSFAGNLLAIVPRPLRDFAYRMFAKNRHRFTFGGDACITLTADQRPRFLDHAT